MIENIHKISIRNIEQSKNSAARMAPNTDRAELILMFEKFVPQYIFLFKL